MTAPRMNGLDIIPNGKRINWYSTILSGTGLLGSQSYKNRKKSRLVLSTSTVQNVFFTSADTITLFVRVRSNTPTKFLIITGPRSNVSFNDWWDFFSFDDVSITRQRAVVLESFTMPWCGRYGRLVFFYFDFSKRHFANGCHYHGSTKFIHYFLLG